LTELFPIRWPRLWLIFLSIISAFLIFRMGFFRFTNADKNSPTVASPPKPVVSACKELPPGMRRIGAKLRDRYMLQFDVPETEAVIRESTSDAPLVYGFDIKPRGSESRLEVSFGPQQRRDRARGSFPHVLKRIMVDDKGHCARGGRLGIPKHRKNVGGERDSKDGLLPTTDLRTNRKLDFSTELSILRASLPTSSWFVRAIGNSPTTAQLPRFVLCVLRHTPRCDILFMSPLLRC
jgi:hypothetical protein